MTRKDDQPTLAILSVIDGAMPVMPNRLSGFYATTFIPGTQPLK
jgi:hypothetical protein